MSTDDNDKLTLTELGSGYRTVINKTGGYDDPTGVYPDRLYVNTSSTNFAARGLKKNKLYLGGGDNNINLELEEGVTSQYPLNQVRETVSGHVQEIDDTPGNERMLFKHKTGAGVEMRADGSVCISARNNSINITGGDQKIIIEGDAQISYNGNVDMDISGDYNVRVGGDYTVKTQGNKLDKTRGWSAEEVSKDKFKTFHQNSTEYVMGSTSEVKYGPHNKYIRGNYKEVVEGNIERYNSGTLVMTSEGSIAISTPIYSLAAPKLSMLGNGTIGGDNMIYYAKNYYGTSATFTAGVTAPTFHGDLKGNAQNTYAQGYAEGATSGGGSITDTATDATATVTVTTAMIADHIANSSLAVKKVKVDPGDELKNSITKETKNGGLFVGELSINEIRSKMRDRNNSNNEAFIGQMIAEGKLNPEFIIDRPPAIGRIESKDPTARRGKIRLGSSDGQQARFVPIGYTGQIDLVPDPKFNPDFQSNITNKTKLFPGISIAKFTGAFGDSVTLDHLSSDEKRALARQLYLQAQAMNMIDRNEGVFTNQRLVVSEGLYKAAANEVLDLNSVNFKKSKGYAIVYQLKDNKGVSPLDKTYDLATYWKDNLKFDKLILDYDTYDPDGTINAQVILIMPELIPSWRATFKNQLETRFNNYVQTTNELVEIKAKAEEIVSLR